jgi:uncharacterized protein (DUF362 family)
VAGAVIPPAGRTRREFLGLAAGGLAAAAWAGCWRRPRSAVFVAKVAGYGADLAGPLRAALRELGVTPAAAAGRRVLIKPNLVEPSPGAAHVTTHPAVVLAAAEAFLALGAASVVVAEGSGHCRDAVLVLEASGLGEALRGGRLRFIDLNTDDWQEVRNAGGASGLATFALPRAVLAADWVVSAAKMKTHHWAGVTLSMKNLFGVLPGALYGWPKNVLHRAGIHRCVADLWATLRPDFAIVDGIVGMEGDGPILGAPKAAGVLVVGRDLPAVDATAARIMGVDPARIGHLAILPGGTRAIAEGAILQRGEPVAAVATPFALVERIEAQRGIRPGAGRGAP